MHRAQEITLRMVAAYVRDEARFKNAKARGKIWRGKRTEFFRLYGQVGEAMKGLSAERKEAFRNWWDKEVKKVDMHGGIIGGW